MNCFTFVLTLLLYSAALVLAVNAIGAVPIVTVLLTIVGILGGVALGSYLLNRE